MKKLDFDFLYYHNANTICIKPIDSGPIQSHNRNLGIFGRCEDPSSRPNLELEERYYKGLDRFYMYDIKLCHTTFRSQYRDFITELLQRGETETCAVHISNSTVPNEFNSITPLYEINYFKVLLKTILTIKQNVIIEISNKRLGESKPYHDVYEKSVIELLENDSNVKHYMIREEPYERTIYQENGRAVVKFSDENTHPILKKEVTRYNQ